MVLRAEIILYESRALSKTKDGLIAFRLPLFLHLGQMKCKVKVCIGLSKEFIAVYVCLESILVDCMRHFADDNVLFVFACQKKQKQCKTK